MKKIKITRKRVLLSLLFLFLLAISHYVGGVIGFFLGSTSASYHSDSDTYSTSLALIKLRNEDYKGAIDLLETRLDTEILGCGTSGDAHKSVYNIYWMLFQEGQKETQSFLLSSVAEYRNQYPSSSSFPTVRQQIENILKEASKGIEE